MAHFLQLVSSSTGTSNNPPFKSTHELTSLNLPLIPRENKAI